VGNKQPEKLRIQRNKNKLLILLTFYTKKGNEFKLKELKSNAILCLTAR